MSDVSSFVEMPLEVIKPSLADEHSMSVNEGSLIDVAVSSWLSL